MILYIVTFIAAVISIIEMYYRFKENTNRDTKTGIIRHILFPIIIVFSIFYGAYKAYDATFDILYTQDEMYRIETNFSTEKKSLLGTYEMNVWKTEYKYDEEIKKIDYQMRGLSYYNEIEKDKLIDERKALQDTLLGHQKQNLGGREYYYTERRKLDFIDRRIASLSQKDTLLTTDKVYEYHKKTLELMSEKQTNLSVLSDNYSKDLKLLEFETKEKKKGIENERTKYIINLFLAIILFSVFLIINSSL